MICSAFQPDAADTRAFQVRRSISRFTTATLALLTPCNLTNEFGLPSRSLTQRVAAHGLACALAPVVFKARFDRRDHLKAAVAALAIRHWPTVASRRALVER
jgi:hypothetical protein